MARNEVEVHFKPVIDAPTVRPGDKLLVRIPVGATKEHVQRMADDLKERLPDVEVCVIAADQLVIYRPEDKRGVELVPPRGFHSKTKFGDAVIKREDDGTYTVERADSVIGLSVELLANADPDALRVTSEGHLSMGSDGLTLYRPVGFDPAHGTRMLICERVSGNV